MACALTVLLAGFLGFCLGIRRERGRLSLIRHIETERRANSGVKLKSIRVRR